MRVEAGCHHGEESGSGFALKDCAHERSGDRNDGETVAVKKKAGGRAEGQHMELLFRNEQNKKDGRGTAHVRGSGDRATEPRPEMVWIWRSRECTTRKTVRFHLQKAD